MSQPDLPERAAVDWDEWRTPLRQFTEATGLVTSAYDTAGRRQVGPLTASRMTALLAGSRLWDEDGPGTACERRLVQRVVADGLDADELFCDSLRVCATALTAHGAVYGVLVFGWRFRDFSSPMACEQIARQVGLAGHVLWSEVRLDAPVSDARMATYAGLLTTLATSIDRQRETIADLNRLNRTRELFLATVSHEMRTPLSALSLRIELMLRGAAELPPPVVAGLQSMRKHVREEAAMVDDLIDAALTLTGQMSVARAPITLDQVLRDATSTVEAQAQQKRIRIALEPPGCADAVRLVADARRLQQVFWNLLFNAIKFTPEEGSIAIAVRQPDGWVEVDIRDSGQGIEPDQLPHVFGAFKLQRAGNASGLGLGLYIARRIVELHGGTLAVHSAGRGHGTTFTVRVPAAPG